MNGLLRRRSAIGIVDVDAVATAGLSVFAPPSLRPTPSICELYPLLDRQAGPHKLCGAHTAIGSQGAALMEHSRLVHRRALESIGLRRPRVQITLAIIIVLTLLGI